MKALAILAVLAALPATAGAQDVNVATLEDGTSVTTLTTGAEHGVVIGAGYGYVAGPVVVGADLTVDPADARDLRLRAGVLVPIVGDGAWRVLGGVDAVARTAHTELADMVDVGTDISVLAGHYTPHWFAAAEVGFDWAIATHIAPSDAYRMVVYPDARAGWYRNTDGLFRFGVQGGVSFGKSDIILRAGMLRDDGGNPPLFPFYGTLGYDRRW